MDQVFPQVSEASVAGLFKTILIILGTFVLIRFLGKFMIAKRNIEEERELLRREKEFTKERQEKMKNFGKVSVSKETPKGKVQDVDYEEIN